MSDPIVAYLHEHLPDYLRDLELLVNQDSGSDDKAGVDAVNDWLAHRLASMGFTVTRHRQERHGDDLVARRHGQGSARIMLLGHADTVFPRGTTAERPMTIDGDLVLGPGTCDMKAGLLTGLYAVAALDHVGWDNVGTLSYVVVSDEEIAERHSIPLLMAEGPGHDAILTLEAARENGDIVTARKAVRWYTVEARGKSSHAGVEPEKGRSAVLALAHLIVQADGLNDLARGLTVNPGEIRGGGNPSVVVDRASVRFDLRAWSTADLDALAGRLRALVDTEWVPGVTMTMALEPGSDCPAMERTPGVAALEELAIAIARELGFPLRGAATGGGSDISFAGHQGTPGLDGLGPIGGLDHGPDEYILLSSIVPRTALLARLIQAIGDRGGRLV